MKKGVLIPFDRYERWQAMAERNQKTIQEKIDKNSQSIDVRVPEEKKHQNLDTEKEEKSSLDAALILSCLRRDVRERAKMLMENMQWNEKGQVLKAGESCNNSHIVDVLQRTFSNGNDEVDDDSEEESAYQPPKRKWKHF
jgi:hypothetical protein